MTMENNQIYQDFLQEKAKELVECKVTSVSFYVEVIAYGYEYGPYEAESEELALKLFLNDAGYTDAAKIERVDNHDEATICVEEQIYTTGRTIEGANFEVESNYTFWNMEI